MKIEPDLIILLHGHVEVENTSDADLLRINKKLDPGTYKRMNAVLEAMGGKWNRKHAAHVFEPGVAISAVKVALVAGEVLCAKQDLGYFPTPADLADRMVTQAATIRLKGVSKGADRSLNWLEPSAGDGAIVRAIRRHSLTDAIAAVEVNDAMRSKLELSLGIAHAASRGYGHVRIADFLTLNPNLKGTTKADCIVMNPPFGKGVEIDHVRHAGEFMAPGGVLVAIMPAGVSFRGDSKHTAFRRLVSDNSGTIVKLPESSFKQAGTGVSTVMVTMRGLK